MIEVVPIPFLIFIVLQVVVHEVRDVLELETAVSLQITDSLADKPLPEKKFCQFSISFYLTWSLMKVIPVGGISEGLVKCEGNLPFPQPEQSRNIRYGNT